jgi:hypothetical protein
MSDPAAARACRLTSLPESPARLTLDTNVIREWWDDRARRDRVEELLELQSLGEVDLVVSHHIRDDICGGRLIEMLRGLPALRVRETGGAFRLGHSTLSGSDGLGAEDFDLFAKSVAYLELLSDLLQCGTIGRRHIPDRRDWLHLHAHHLGGRDAFLTWDRGILALAPALTERFRLSVMTPEEFLRSACRGEL